MYFSPCALGWTKQTLHCSRNSSYFCGGENVHSVFHSKGQSRIKFQLTFQAIFWMHQEHMCSCKLWQIMCLRFSLGKRQKKKKLLTSWAMFAVLHKLCQVVEGKTIRRVVLWGFCKTGSWTCILCCKTGLVV